MLIAIDVDEVLAEFSSHLFKHVKKKYHKDADLHVWNTLGWFHAWGGTKQTAVAKIMDFMDSREFLRIKPVKGAARGVKKLKKAGHELVVITGRPNEVEKETREWIEKYFPGIFNEVHLTNFHLARGGSATKGTLCAKLGVELLVDDFVDYIKECAEQGIRAMLFTTKYNKDAKIPEGVIRVNSWPDVVKKVNNINHN